MAQDIRPWPENCYCSPGWTAHSFFCGESAMPSHRTVRNSIALAVAGVAVAVVWSFHVGAQERIGRELRREVRSERRQAREGTGADRDPSSHDPHGQPTPECAAECAECQQVCDSCAAHCLMLVADGQKEHQQTLQTCLDCAEICAAADRVVARGGPFSDVICRACAEACARCAAACEKFPDDEHMARCAKECRKCQQACETMLGEGKNSARAGQDRKTQ